MITPTDRTLLSRTDWTLPELVHLAYTFRSFLALLDAALGVRRVLLPVDSPLPVHESPLPPAGGDPGPGPTASSALPIPRRLATALRAVDGLRTHAELEAVQQRVRERLGVA